MTSSDTAHDPAEVAAPLGGAASRRRRPGVRGRRQRDVRLAGGRDGRRGGARRPRIGPDRRHLPTDDYRAVVRRDHPFAREAGISLAELLEDPLIIYGGGYEEQIRELHHMAGLPFESNRRVRELATLTTMVEKGLGVSILPSLGAGMLGPRLVMLPLTPRLQRIVMISGPQTRPWHPLVTALLEELDAP